MGSSEVGFVAEGGPGLVGREAHGTNWLEEDATEVLAASGSPGRTSSPEWLLLASLSLEGGPSCLLLFQEALQDLTKAPFKLLPLSLDSEHVGFCVHTL